MSLKKIAYLQRRVPHYRLPFFRELEKQLQHIDLEVLTSPLKEKGGSGIRPDYSGLNNFYFFDLIRWVFLKKLFHQRGLSKHVKKQDYDLVVVEGTLNNFSVWKILLSRKLKKKRSIIWLKGWPNANNKFDYLFRKFFLSLANSYVVYGEKSVDLLRTFNVNQNKIVVAQNTVQFGKLLDDEKENDSIRTLSDECKENDYLLYFGRIVEKKRILDLIKVFQKYSSENTNISLVIVGDGPGRPQLERFIANNSIPNVFFTGKVTDTELYQIIRESLVCVFPGAVGLSVNQAMAAGKLVICADEPGPDSELIKHGITGIRFEKENLDQLFKYIKKYSSNNPDRESIAKKAQKFVSENATIQNMANMHVLAVKEELK